SQGCGGWGGGPGYGPGYGRGPGWRGQGGGQMGGPCVTGRNAPCWRVQNPERHAACWKEADAKGLRAAARRSFMTSCMTGAAKAP
ncbi:PsiF family protein, partial [Rhodoplanes serenus]